MPKSIKDRGVYINAASSTGAGVDFYSNLETETAELLNSVKTDSLRFSGGRSSSKGSSRGGTSSLSCLVKGATSRSGGSTPNDFWEVPSPGDKDEGKGKRKRGRKSFDLQFSVKLELKYAPHNEAIRLKHKNK